MEMSHIDEHFVIFKGELSFVRTYIPDNLAHNKC